jgi:hypothetical protein
VRWLRWSLVIAAVALVVLASPAVADEGEDQDEADATKDSNGNPVVTVWTDGDVHVPPGRRGSGSVTCEWFEPVDITMDPVDWQARRVGPRATGLVEGNWYFLRCTGGDGAIVREEWRQWTPADAAAMARELGIEAASELPLPYPTPHLSPDIDGEQLVGFPSWLWVDRAAWQTFEATASIPGLSATAVATPVRTRWDMGDDSDEMVCEGPGTPYDAGVADGAQSTECSHIFQWASVTAEDRAGVYDATVYVDWEIAWSATNGERGTLPATTRGTTFPARVIERQAVVCHGTGDDCPDADA